MTPRYPEFKSPESLSVGVKARRETKEDNEAKRPGPTGHQDWQRCQNFLSSSWKEAEACGLAKGPRTESEGINAGRVPGLVWDSVFRTRIGELVNLLATQSSILH